jgi:hypothetical protein
MATVDSLARLALAAFRELRALSVRDLVRSLLVLLSERLDSGQGGYRVRFFGCCVFVALGWGGWMARCAFVCLPDEIGGSHTRTRPPKPQNPNLSFYSPPTIPQEPDSRASGSSQHGSSKGPPLLGSMGSSLKTALFHSFKVCLWRVLSPCIAIEIGWSQVVIV